MAATEAAGSAATEHWSLPPTLLPDGERRDLWVADGRLTTTPVGDAIALPGRFALPGLVDAHCHLAMTGDAGARDLAGARAALARARDAGVLLIRDVGAPRSVTLELGDELSAEHLQVAGRWLAPAGAFFEDLHAPVSADELPSAATAEIARGAMWVKIVTDWPQGEGPERRPVPSYDIAALRATVDGAHAAGARVAAHCISDLVVELVELGVDSIEHGTGLDEHTLRKMAERGIAWTPTLCAVTSPLPDDAPRYRKARHRAVVERVHGLLPVASRLGVPILAGTDSAGTLADEVSKLVQAGLEPVEALRSASSTARAFLGAPGLADGALADVVTYDDDPRDDPEVLTRPAAILMGGRRVH